MQHTRSLLMLLTLPRFALATSRHSKRPRTRSTWWRVLEYVLRRRQSTSSDMNHNVGIKPNVRQREHSTLQPCAAAS